MEQIITLGKKRCTGLFAHSKSCAIHLWLSEEKCIVLDGEITTKLPGDSIFTTQAERSIIRNA